MNSTRVIKLVCGYIIQYTQSVCIAILIISLYNAPFEKKAILNWHAFLSLNHIQYDTRNKHSSPFLSTIL
jgi:hypothetical protein